jgi:O-antigen/teichoic acid export membrane protein
MRRNIAANLAGRLVTSGLRAALLPLYLHILDVETYGLVSVYTALRTLLAILDFGIGAAFIRDLARLSASSDAARRRRELFQTLEIIYWTMAVVAGLVVVVIAPFLAQNWLHAQHFSPPDLERALRLMGIAIAVAFPLAFYHGGIIGLQRQGLANVLSVGLGAFQDVGALLVITATPTIYAFMSWHICGSLIAVTVTAVVLRRLIPAVDGARRFSTEACAGSLRFGVGWLGHSAGSAIVAQSDKILVTRFVPLEQFGYYAIAQSAAMFLMTLVSPVQIAAFPRISQLVGVADRAAVKHEYERATQYMAFLLFPVAAVLIAFAPEVLLVWTRKVDVAVHATTLLRIFIIGACCGGVAAMVTTVQGAYASFRAILTTSLISALLAFPVVYVALKECGMSGAAVVWTVQNGALLLTASYAHRTLGLGAATRWFCVNVLAPAGAAAAVAFLGRVVMPPLEPRTFPFVIGLGLVWACCSAAAALVLSHVRTAAHDLRVRWRSAAAIGK